MTLDEKKKAAVASATRLLGPFADAAARSDAEKAVAWLTDSFSQSIRRRAAAPRAAEADAWLRDLSAAAGRLGQLLDAAEHFRANELSQILGHAFPCGSFADAGDLRARVARLECDAAATRKRLGGAVRGGGRQTTSTLLDLPEIVGLVIDCAVVFEKFHGAEALSPGTKGQFGQFCRHVYEATLGKGAPMPMFQKALREISNNLRGRPLRLDLPDPLPLLAKAFAAGISKK